MTELVLPSRIQRKRIRGWRKPDNAVIVDRTSKWGNPFVFNSPREGLARVPAIDGSAWEYEGRISEPGADHAYHHPDGPNGEPGKITGHRVRLLTRAECVELYRLALFTGEPRGLWHDRGLGGFTRRITPDDVRRELAGKDLVCFCALNQVCHADVLLEVANRKEVKAVRDRIPEIAAGNGDSVSVIVASEPVFRDELVRKLGEELREFLDSGAADMTELADLVEVAYAICPDLDRYREAKNQTAGAFAERLVMVERSRRA